MVCGTKENFFVANFIKFDLKILGCVDAESGYEREELKPHNKEHV